MTKKMNPVKLVLIFLTELNVQKLTIILVLRVN